ncbi:alpha/beta hydrolase fold-domain-containing protein [Mycotypha africana]|uniref:alpha/beta hydrolase fold-domain-containing protein n=1 Tax=Mycotypha africana TaxID=64632 RepID=UPI0022FFD54A|nr:alpha/beta hydrolase fold-domain-containing protein [Mycotypha africana]KAI8971944.1 alpha/beta hydrolase fold-domain-containing protein [Mycotypha africana]
MSTRNIDYSFLNPIHATVAASFPLDIDPTKVSIEHIRQTPKPQLSDDVLRPEVDIESIIVPSHTDGHLFPVDIYRPKGIKNMSTLPAVIYFHGGGFCLEGEDGHPFLMAKLATEANCAVFYVHYSLSPEAKFPIALEECYTMVSSAVDPEVAAGWNIDPTRVAVGGDSAGGNLTAAVTLLAKQRNALKNSIKYQILYYPVLMNSFDSESYKKYGQGFLVPVGLSKMFHDNYKSDEATDDNIFFCPGKASIEDLKGLPPAFLMTCEADVLLNEGEEYARKLLLAKVPVTAVRINAAIHGFMSAAPLYSEETLIVIDATTGALRRVFGT